MNASPGAGVLPENSRLLDAFPDPTFALDLRGLVLHANTAACDLLGAASCELVGVPLTGLLFDERTRGGFYDILSVVVAGGSWSGELDTTGRHGGVGPAGFTVRPVLDGTEVSGALVVVTEVVVGDTEQVRLSHRLTQLARVAAELVLAESVETVTKIVVEHVAEAAGATVGSLSLRVDEHTLALVGVRGGREGVASRWATYPVDGSTPAGDAVRTGRMVVLDSREEIHARYPGLETAAEGERSIACLPLQVGERCIGVASLSFPGRRVLTATELELLSVMAGTCAQAIERVRMTTEAADRSAKLQFLADASVELSRSLDYELTLKKVARLAVPWFADWCTIAVDQDGVLRTLAVAHVDPDKVEMAEELQRRYPPDPHATTGSYQVLRTGESELIPEITDEMLAQLVPDPEHLRLLRKLNIRSALSVPLRLGDQTLGVVTWIAGQEGRRFGSDDQVFGEDLAHRAAIAIDTARLHSELSEVATRLQRAILPALLPTLPGWDMAASYLQAGHSDAGGDFYDVTPLDDGRMAFFVGDVMGRGVTAAAAMAQMRAAIRALVTVEPDPTAVLMALDRLFEQYDFHQLVTLVYAVADPGRDELVVANAGHPPPVVRRTDGTVEVVAGEPGLLLGAGGGLRAPITVPFRSGDLFLAYTDGLVERRDEDIEAGVTRLVDACADRDHHDLATWVAAVVLASRDTRRDDDVAVLAVRRQDAPADEGLR